MTLYKLIKLFTSSYKKKESYYFIKKNNKYLSKYVLDIDYKILKLYI